METEDLDYEPISEYFKTHKFEADAGQTLSPKASESPVQQRIELTIVVAGLHIFQLQQLNTRSRREILDLEPDYPQQAFKLLRLLEKTQPDGLSQLQQHSFEKLCRLLGECIQDFSILNPFEVAQDCRKVLVNLEVPDILIPATRLEKAVSLDLLWRGEIDLAANDLYTLFETLALYVLPGKFEDKQNWRTMVHACNIFFSTCVLNKYQWLHHNTELASHSLVKIGRDDLTFDQAKEKLLFQMGYLFNLKGQKDSILETVDLLEEVESEIKRLENPGGLHPAQGSFKSPKIEITIVLAGIHLFRLQGLSTTRLNEFRGAAKPKQVYRLFCWHALSELEQACFTNLSHYLGEAIKNAPGLSSTLVVKTCLQVLKECKVPTSLGDSRAPFDVSLLWESKQYIEAEEESLLGPCTIFFSTALLASYNFVAAKGQFAHQHNLQIYWEGTSTSFAQVKKKILFEMGKVLFCEDKGSAILDAVTKLYEVGDQVKRISNLERRAENQQEASDRAEQSIPKIKRYSNFNWRM
ncbi:hypothetical protein T439DRAFT_335842 [Meredithblackwellia eburnea MCA 4105]